jgi:hypothetical protein
MGRNARFAVRARRRDALALSERSAGEPRDHVGFGVYHPEAVWDALQALADDGDDN